MVRSDLEWTRPSEMSYYAVVAPRDVLLNRTSLGGNEAYSISRPQGFGSSASRYYAKQRKMEAAYGGATGAKATVMKKLKEDWGGYFPWHEEVPVPWFPFTGTVYFDRLLGLVKTHPRGWMQEPPVTAPWHRQWIQLQLRVFGPDAAPRPTDPAQAKIWDDASYRARHVGGVFGSIARGFQKFGGVIITVVGAALSPFTGGASLIAASVLNAGRSAVLSGQAASAAKRQGAADAAKLQAEADKQKAAVAAQVEKFYKDNPAWFLQYGMTPDKWVKLTLDQKLEFINAGVERRLPAATQPTTLSEAQQTQQLEETARAAQRVGVPPERVLPPGAGGGEQPPFGYETVAEEEARAVQAPAQAGAYEAMIEGQSVGKFTSLSEVTKAVLDHSNRGDRFEVLFNGKSTGLRIRTTDGSIEAPAELESKIRSLSYEQMLGVVDKAEKEIAAKKGGGFPWWVILAGGAAVAAAS
ncbi:MAG: hypothetical protein ACREYE_22205 [Gammaproteobacteria bacterium]